MQISLQFLDQDMILGFVVTFTHHWSNVFGLVEMDGYLVVWYMNWMVVEMFTYLTFLKNITTIANLLLLNLSGVKDSGF